MQDKERQRMQNYAVQLRDIVNNSISTDGLDEDAIKIAQKAKRDDVYHKIGVSFFDEPKRSLILKTLDMLSSFHLHIIQSGELETILQDYGVPYQDKNKWVVSAINKIAEMPKEDFKPTSTLYQFLDRIMNSQ